MRKFIIAGYSGHAFVIMDTILKNEDKVIGYFEKEKKKYNPFSMEYLGYEANTNVLKKYKGSDIFIALAIGDNSIRKKMFSFFNKQTFQMPPVIDADASVASYANIGDASYIAQGSKINAVSEIGTAVILNTDSIVEHECSIGNFVHIGPGAVILGNVTVKEQSFVGANSVIKQGVTIGKCSIIGAGSVVLKDVPAGEVWAGNPAKPLS